MLKFSIVVPVYNNENYLEECIASVFSQTYTHFELILVNDGSTDKSAEICDRYALQYADKVTAWHNSNHGPFYTRLYGVEVATGDVIVFLDADDSLRADALEILRSCYAKFDCDMVIYNAQPCDRFPSIQITIPLEHETVFEGDSKKSLYRSVMHSRAFNSVCLKSVKRQCAQLLDCIPVDCRLKHGEDLLLSASFITTSPKIVYINEGLYHYRSTPGSITHGYSTELKESLKTVHGILDKIIDLWKEPALIQIHNARKVSGWMDILVVMLKSKPALPEEEVMRSIKRMANDPYFISAYGNMFRGYLTLYYRVLSWCMYKKLYRLLIVVDKAKTAAARLIKKCFRR